MFLRLLQSSLKIAKLNRLPIIPKDLLTHFPKGLIMEIKSIHRRQLRQILTFFQNLATAITTIKETTISNLRVNHRHTHSQNQITASLPIQSQAIISPSQVKHTPGPSKIHSENQLTIKQRLRLLTINRILAPAEALHLEEEAVKDLINFIL